MDVRLLLGVDTGGTYTDAVVVTTGGEVVASAKALTTRHDLAIGVSEAISSVLTDVDTGEVGIVSVSTTLATNAVVEGQGSPVLVLAIGFDEAMLERSGIRTTFADVTVVAIDGGHDHHGQARVSLDEDAVHAALEAHGGHVSAVAICAAFAVRNPAHEQQARDLVLAETDLPVTISSTLSEALDAPRRALTTALNARLLSRIADLVSAVSSTLDHLGVDTPVLVARGDGSLAVADLVARRPIETVLSGPAASIIGAGVLTGLDSFILSDIGGTTTDVGQLVDGRPRLAPEGAIVGGWRTMVQAIDVRTTGLGGDSEVRTESARVSVGPQRRVPVSLIGRDHPDVLRELVRQRQDPPSRDLAAEFVVRLVDDIPESCSGLEARVLERLTPQVPKAVVEVAAGTVERRALRACNDRGLVQLAGFTPSDAAHVLGLQANWSPEAAVAAAEVVAWYTGLAVEDFCRDVWSETVRRSAGTILDVATNQPVGSDSLAVGAFDAVATGAPQIGTVDIALRLSDPVVAVGGPAGVYYGEVGERIGAEIVLPDNHAVANAVGAAMGSLVSRASAEVATDGPGMFRVISLDGVQPVADATSALDSAQTAADVIARRQLDEMAAGLGTVVEPEVRIEVERHDAPDAEGDDGLYSAIISVEARARPWS